MTHPDRFLSGRTLCPVCGAEAVSFVEHDEGAVCVACAAGEVERHRQYQPCGHIVTVK